MKAWGYICETMEENSRNFISLNDALRFFEPLSIGLMVKPVGASCPLACNYCYYREAPRGVMSRALLEKTVREAVSVPLVLHGGSGIPDDQLKVAFARGINKFNYGTNYLAAYYRAARQFIHETENLEHPNILDMFKPAQAALVAHMKDRFRLCRF